MTLDLARWRQEKRQIIVTTRRESIDPIEFYEMATSPTSNQQFDDGLWLGPVLRSDDPGIDSRARDAVHYFADDHIMSVCGIRFAPEHYIQIPDPQAEARQACSFCTELINLAKSENLFHEGAFVNGRDDLPVIPRASIFTSAEFQGLIRENAWLGFRINRMKLIDDDLHLMVDFGRTYTRSIKRMINAAAKRADEIVLIWNENPTEETVSEALDELMIRRPKPSKNKSIRAQHQESEPQEIGLDPDNPDYAPTSLQQWRESSWKGACFEEGMTAQDLVIHSFAPGQALSLCGRAVGTDEDLRYDIGIRGLIGSSNLQDQARKVCECCEQIMADDAFKPAPNQYEHTRQFPSRAVSMKKFRSIINGRGFTDGAVTRVLVEPDDRLLILFIDKGRTSRRRMRAIVKSLQSQIIQVQVVRTLDAEN